MVAMQLFSATHLNDEANERRVVNWLGVIAVLSMIGVVYLASAASKTEFGIDSAVIVALIGITAQCASSLGTRRTRQAPGDPTGDLPTASGGTAKPAPTEPTVTVQRGDTTVTVPAVTFAPVPPPPPDSPADDDYLGH